MCLDVAFNWANVPYECTISDCWTFELFWFFPILWKIKHFNWLFFCCCSLSHGWTFATPRTAARQASLSFTISQSLLNSTESVMPASSLILYRHLLLLTAIFPTIRVFSSESAVCIRWPKYWNFSPSNEYSGLISFRIDLAWSLCRPGDSQESSPTPQFKSINSVALSLLYGPTFTSLHDYWKSHSFDYRDSLKLL